MSLQDKSTAIGQTVRKSNELLVKKLMRGKPQYLYNVTRDGKHVFYSKDPEHCSCRRVFFTSAKSYPHVAEVVAFAPRLAPIVPYSKGEGSLRDLLVAKNLYPKLKSNINQVLFFMSPQDVRCPPKPFGARRDAQHSHVSSPLALSIRSHIVEFGPNSYDQVKPLLSRIDVLAETDGCCNLLQDSIYRPGDYYTNRAALLFIRHTQIVKTVPTRFLRLVETIKCTMCKEVVVHHTWGYSLPHCKCLPYDFKLNISNKCNIFMLLFALTGESVTVKRLRQDITVNRDPKASKKYCVPTVKWGPLKTMSDQHAWLDTDTSILDTRENNSFRHIMARIKGRFKRGRNKGKDSVVRTVRTDHFLPHIAAHPSNLEWLDK